MQKTATIWLLLLLWFPSLLLSEPAKKKNASSPPPGNSSDPKKILPVPSFSVPGGVFTNTFSVQLSASVTGAVVRYTLDGKDPVESSTLFSAPIKITGTTLIKAKTFTASATSPTLCQTYVLLDDSLVGFNSNLPLVILHTFEGYVSPQTPIPISAHLINNTGGRTFLTSPADFDGRGTLKSRGRSSLEYPKNSFSFHTKDDEGNSLKVPLLGLPKESEWVLYAPYPDKTLMRDVLAYELSNATGHYAPRTKFVELFVSRSGTKLSNRSYFGVYVLVEKIKRGKHRVDIAKLDPQDNTEPAISGGYIFKRDHWDKPQPRFATARGSRFYYVEPKPDEITPAQKRWLTGYLNQFESALYGSSFRDPQQGYAHYIDVDSFIDHHWIVEMSKNVDGIRFSNFLHKDRGGKIHMDPIWDWNLSFGNASGRQGWTPEGWYWSQLDDSEYFWFGRLFEDPDFAQKSIDRWAALRTNVFSTTRILTRVDEMASQLREAQARNFRRWPILGRYVHPNWYVGRTYDEEVRWMKQWIQNRLQWIDGQYLSAPNLSLKDSSLASGASLTLDAKAGKIFYTLDKTDPRLPGGAVSPSARLYTSPITLKESTQIFARARSGNTWSSPTVSPLKVGKR